MIYVNTERQVNTQANTELRLLVDMVRSIQGYVAGHLRPFMLEKGLMYSPGISGIVATSLVAEKFAEQQPAYYIKNISDNPPNPANKPQPFEAELLKRFRTDGYHYRNGEVVGVSLVGVPMADIQGLAIQRSLAAIASS